jgi:dihydrofolate synthase/folylpolyglutamate synthase
VLEVGLGGRLDSTNIVLPVAAAITSIARDHEAQLGHTLESIAFEKAGVIKPGIPVVCGDVPPEAEEVIRAVCRERSARFIPSSSCGPDVAQAAAGIALRGAHQQANARVAACLLRELDALGISVNAGAIRTGLTDVCWPGRLELLAYRGAEILLDAAHNPAGARALAAYLREAGWTGAALVFGVMRDKDATAMLAELADVCGSIVCTTPDTPRAMAADEVARAARSLPGRSWSVSTVAVPADAIAAALRGGSRVVVAGSIFLIGPLRGILRAR